VIIIAIKFVLVKVVGENSLIRYSMQTMTTTFSSQKTVDDSIPSAMEIASEIPFNQEHKRTIAQMRKTVTNILNGKDDRLLFIVGPCSIHNTTSALTYAKQLKKVSEKVSDRIVCVMRTYFEKPRTITGWKGLLYDPDLDESCNLLKGIRQARSLLVDLTELQMPCASELLELTTHHYYADFLSWACIGARTSCSQPHRQLAATLNFSCGFKNSTHGNLDHPIQGMIAAQSPQTFLGVTAAGKLSRIRAQGNPHCHLILRGGKEDTNYQADAVLHAIEKCNQVSVSPNIIVDASHGNSHKNPYKQIEIIKELVHQRNGGQSSIRGLMMESHLLAGSQPLSTHLPQPDRSITDPCLDWASTESLIHWIYSILN